MNEIFVSREGEQYGPYSLAELTGYVSEGRFSDTDQAWHEAKGEWVSLASILPRSVPPPATKPGRVRKSEARSGPIPDNDYGSEKKILPALILWFFIGVIGGHHFYLGNISRGFVYLVCLVAVYFFTFSRIDISNYIPPYFPDSIAIFSEIALGLLPSVLLGVALLFDLIRLVSGKLTDGNGEEVVDWT